jgi:hypothetical protein
MQITAFFGDFKNKTAFFLFLNHFFQEMEKKKAPRLVKYECVELF